MPSKVELTRAEKIAYITPFVDRLRCGERKWRKYVAMNRNDPVISDLVIAGKKIDDLIALRGQEFYDNARHTGLHTSETRELTRLETEFRRVYRVGIDTAYDAIDEARVEAKRKNKEDVNKAALTND